MSLTKVSFSMINGAAVNVLDFGATGDGITNDTAAIQAAIDAASVSGQTVYFPAGTYSIVPATTKVWEGAGTMTTAFVMRSNMHLWGDGNATIKLANNCSTTASPKLLAMFFSNEQLTNLSWRGLVMDMNGLNNLISPSAPSSFNRYNQAMIHFSGTIGGVAARADYVTIENCSFLNTAGVSCILMQQSNTASVTMSSNWTIRNCLFKNNGVDTDDHSSIFGWANNVLIDGNTFTADSMYPNGVSGNSGTLVAYEVHGANQRFVNNLVRNYYQGMWVAANLSTDADNVVIEGNTFSPIGNFGVNFYRESAAESSISKILINGNTFGLDDTAYADPLKYAVFIGSQYSIKDVVISNNIASKIGTTKSSAAFSVVGGGTSGQKHTNIKISGNEAKGFNYGVRVTTTVNADLGAISITDNAFFELAAYDIVANAAGIQYLLVAGAQKTDELVIFGNVVSDPGTGIDYGIRLENGTITNLSIDGNSFNNIQTTEIVIASTTTFRSGAQARLFSAAPTTGTWRRSDIVWNSAPSAGGTPGWVCVTSGTPGTWKAMANLAV